MTEFSVIAEDLASCPAIILGKTLRIA